jgi:hypothetical protein
MLLGKGHSAIGVGVRIALLSGLIVGSNCLLVDGYRVIEEMEQAVEAKTATITGRPTWKAGTTIHVYIPNDPEGKGAEQEVRAACTAWEEKLRSETNANLTFQYHVGESAPTVENPPPYVIEVHWSGTSEEDTAEAGRAFPTTDVAPTDKPSEYRRTSEVKRGDIYINRTRSGGDVYSLNAIYNIALHEFGHIFGLDHKTDDQDSVVMADRGIDSPDKKLPVKDDDVRGLQELYGRNAGSQVAAERQAEEEGGEGSGATGGTKCCTFDCGGLFGCVMVNSQAECDMYSGVLAPGTCETTSHEEKDQGVYGRCDGGLGGFCEDCSSDLGRSHYVPTPGSIPAGRQVSFALVITNDGGMPTRFAVAVQESPWLSDGAIESSSSLGPGTDPFDAPPALARCIAPDGEVIITYTATLSDDVPPGEAVTSTIILEDVFQCETYVFIATVCASEEDYTSAIPAEIRDCARLLAWTSGYRHITKVDERWSAREKAPREMCEICAAPMCVVCMEYDLESYGWRPSVTSSLRNCLRMVERYLRTASTEETEVLAAVYWMGYWDGRHNRNRP